MFATFRTLSDRLNEDGFTLVELLVTMLILGILAAVAIPAFFNQTGKAKDAGAKSNLRHLVEVVEGCRVNTTSYAQCDAASELDGAGALTFGSSGGNVGVVSASDTGFIAYSISKATTGNSNHLFIWQRDHDNVTRYCFDMSLRPLDDGGCSNSTW